MYRLHESTRTHGEDDDYLCAREAGQRSTEPTRFRADAWQLIERLADKKRDTDPSLSVAQAVTAVIHERPGLYRVHVTGMHLGEPA